MIDYKSMAVWIDESSTTEYFEDFKTKPKCIKDVQAMNETLLYFLATFS